MDPNVVLFAIEAGVRLGQRLNDALVDTTHSRPLLLPVGELFGAVIESEAIEFFDRIENLALTAPGGPYAGFDRAQLITAYRTLRRLDTALGSHEPTAARDTLLRLHALEQLKRDQATPALLQQVIGEVVTLGIDYFTANPSALGRASPARAILQGLLCAFDHVDFATTPVDVLADGMVGNLLNAALNTLQSSPALLADDARLQALLGGVTRAALDELAGSTGAGERVRRHDLLKRTLTAALEGGAAALAGQLETLLPVGPAATPAVHAALREVLGGIRAHPTLFPNEMVQRLMQATLGMVSERLAAGTRDREQDPAGDSWIERLITGCTQSLFARDAGRVFESNALGMLVEAAIQTAGRHVDLIARENPALEPVFVRALDALGAGFARVADGSVRLSGAPLLAFTRSVFEDVARDPAHLLGAGTDPHRTALAQIVGSVAEVLAADPPAVLSSQGRLALLQVALATAAPNIPRLLRLDDPAVQSNPLFAVLQPLVAAWRAAPPGFGSEQALLDLARRLLPIASANIGALSERHDLPGRIVTRAFDLASGALEGRVDAATLPTLAAGLLREVLWEELDFEDARAVEQAARRTLRAA